MSLGDFGMKALDPTDRYFDIIPNPATLPRRPWIAKPKHTPLPIPGMEAWQQFLRQDIQPDQWTMLIDFLEVLKSDPLFFKRPNWMEAPITGVENELVTEAPVALNATATTLLNYANPDRCIAVVTAFGHALDDPTQWGSVEWNILINQRPIKNWQNFVYQRGMLWNPTKLAMPFVIPPNATFTVTGQNASAVNAFARCVSYVYPLKKFTQDGSYRDHQTK